MSVNLASTIFGRVTWINKGQCNTISTSSLYWPPLWAKLLWTISLPPPQHECKRSVNDFWVCMMDWQSTVHQSKPIINVSAAFMGKNERQWFLVLHHGHSKRCASDLIHNPCIGRHYEQKCYQWYRYHLLRMNVNGPSKIFGVASWTITALHIGVNP